MISRNSPISQVDIEHELMRLLEMLEQETEAFESLAEDSAKKNLSTRPIGLKNIFQQKVQSKNVKHGQITNWLTRTLITRLPRLS